MTERVEGPDGTGPLGSRVEVSTATAEGRLTIVLAGDLDCAVAPALSAQLRDAIGRAAPAHVIIDISGVEFCDAAGVRMLVGLRETASEAGSACCLHGSRPHIRWLLHTLEAGDLLRPSRSEDCAAFSSAP